MFNIAGFLFAGALLSGESGEAWTCPAGVPAAVGTAGTRHPPLEAGEVQTNWWSEEWRRRWNSLGLLRRSAGIQPGPQRVLSQLWGPVRGLDGRWGVAVAPSLPPPPPWFESEHSIWIIVLSFLVNGLLNQEVRCFSVSERREPHEEPWGQPAVCACFPLRVCGRWAPCCVGVVGSWFGWSVRRLLWHIFHLFLPPVNFAKMSYMLKKQNERRTNVVFFFSQHTPTQSSISILLFQPQQPQKKQIYFYLMLISLIWTDLISY